MSENEHIIVDDVLNYYIKLGQASQNSKLDKRTGNLQLQEYGDTFCKTLNPIYERNGNSWYIGDFYRTESFTVYAFYYDKPTDKPIRLEKENQFNAEIEQLLYDATHQSVRYTRVLKSFIKYEGYDVLIFIKPNSLRYWLKSIALRDADEIYVDLKNAGY